MENFTTIENLKIGYQKLKRSDKAIVFLHNSSGSLAIWDKQWEDERFEDYTLVRFDLPGHGLSSHSFRPDDDYSLPGMANMIFKVIERLQTTQYIIVAISLATSLTGEIAHLLTGCNGFFMVGASIISNGITPADILLPFEFGSVLFEEDPSDDALENYVKGLLFNEDEALLAKLRHDYRKTDPHFRVAMGGSIAKGAWTDEMQKLVDSGKPVAWVFGKDEQIINSDFLNKMPGIKWPGKLCFIQDAGHLANLDQPEAFNELLLAFAREALG